MSTDTLTTTYLCDWGRCYAAALVTLEKDIGTDLTTDLVFCGHHYNVARASLLLLGFSIVKDNREVGQRFEVYPEDRSGSPIEPPESPVDETEPDDPTPGGVATLERNGDPE